MDVNTIVMMLMPLLIWVVTWIVKKIKPTLSGVTIVAVIIPLLSFAGALIPTLIGTTTPFWLQLVLNFLAIAFNEIKKQIGQAVSTPTQ
jgi:hypothetical protein